MCDFGAQLLGTSRRRCPRYFSESWLFCAEVGCFEDNKGASLGEGIGWQLVVPLLLEDSRSHWVQIPLLLTNPLCCPSSGSMRNFEEMQMSRFSPTIFLGEGELGICFFFSKQVLQETYNNQTWTALAQPFPFIGGRGPAQGGTPGLGVSCVCQVEGQL